MATGGNTASGTQNTIGTIQEPQKKTFVIAPQSCDLCSSIDSATHFCDTEPCNQFICKNCLQAHNKLTGHGSYIKRIHVIHVNQKCTEGDHVKPVLAKHLCEDCCEPLCDECCESHNTKGHGFMELQSAVASLQEEMNNLGAKICSTLKCSTNARPDNLKQRILQVCKAQHQHVKNAAQEERLCLKRKTKTLHDEINLLQKQFLDAVERCEAQNVDEEELEKLLQEVKMLTSDADCRELLKNKERILQALNQMVEKALHKPSTLHNISCQIERTMLVRSSNDEYVGHVTCAWKRHYKCDVAPCSITAVVANHTNGRFLIAVPYKMLQPEPQPESVPQPTSANLSRPQPTSQSAQNSISAALQPLSTGTAMSLPPPNTDEVQTNLQPLSTLAAMSLPPPNTDEVQTNLQPPSTLAAMSSPPANEDKFQTQLVWCSEKERLELGQPLTGVVKAILLLRSGEIVMLVGQDIMLYDENLRFRRCLREGGRDWSCLGNGHHGDILAGDSRHNRLGILSKDLSVVKSIPCPDIKPGQVCAFPPDGYLVSQPGIQDTGPSISILAADGKEVKHIHDPAWRYVYSAVDSFGCLYLAHVRCLLDDEQEETRLGSVRLGLSVDKYSSDGQKQESILKETILSGDCLDICIAAQSDGSEVGIGFDGRFCVFK